MDYKRILTIQDISCVGQCSLTVALPILSAFGYETCILPTGLLSNHTAKDFTGFSFLDTTNEFEDIAEKWISSNILFDCIYTGYIGNKTQIEKIIDKFLPLNKGKLIVDPAMADYGKLYVGFDNEFVEEMKKLCLKADILIPNITEACLLCDEKYKDYWTEVEIKKICKKLNEIYKATIVLTGVPFEKQLGIAVYKDDSFYIYKHIRLPINLHGTGDIYSSVFTGEYLRTGNELKAVKKAGNFVVKCIKNNKESHKYGAMFEPFLKKI